MELNSLILLNTTLLLLQIAKHSFNFISLKRKYWSGYYEYDWIVIGLSFWKRKELWVVENADLLQENNCHMFIIILFFKVERYIKVMYIFIHILTEEK